MERGKERDFDYQDVTVDSVRAVDDGFAGERLEILYRNGTGTQQSIRIPMPDRTIEPGDELRLYIAATSAIRGIDVNGEELFYRTEAQERSRQLGELERARESMRERREAEDAARSAAYESLPREIRDAAAPYVSPDTARMVRFAALEAALILDALPTFSEFRAWERLGDREQRETVPALSRDHSGATYQLTCRIVARVFEERIRHEPRRSPVELS